MAAALSLERAPPLAAPLRFLLTAPWFACAAGLVLLASWIMDVGLYEKEHADALQRDADLVI